jgi:uncharacterized protein
MGISEKSARLEGVRSVVDRILRGQSDADRRRSGFVHLYGVSATCTLLALRRELDVELCAVAGMLHDIATYETGDPRDHGPRGAVRARELLEDMGWFLVEEISAVSGAIAVHSDKAHTHGVMDELLKDADVLQHFLYNSVTGPWEANALRLRAVLGEMGIDGAVDETESGSGSPGR